MEEKEGRITGATSSNRLEEMESSDPGEGLFFTGSTENSPMVLEGKTEYGHQFS